ncbi:hypothetical protein CN692_14185 [Bacillus sp. AFS002410]|uniref:hypothetical protein n=1 Tax=Bacillus sp. AFS002410 TaxID=2033481 RepID=UPI000BEFA27C|nr:hypothetical protein [Bacillus sp. AFS002410]PEJ57043.1 hypothetical protein CN692_14185 [Bacillus sp. AFS002410]
MNVKYKINELQNQLLTRLNARKGTTMFTIIEAISRQAYATSSFVVSQKNSTLAKKCGVTASTISRNLKKIKTLCSDLIKIEQNRNCEEKFAALVFEFIPEGSDLLSNKSTEMSNEMSNGMSNGTEDEPINTDNECVQVAEPTSNLINSTTKYKNINTVKQEVDNTNTIHEAYLKFKSQGINKTLFMKILAQVENKKNIRSFKRYLEGSLSKVAEYLSIRNDDGIDGSGAVPTGIFAYSWI